MTVRVHPSALLRAHCGCPNELELEAGSVRAALAELARREPSLYAGVCDETGAVRRHVNLFVGAKHVRELGGLDAPLRPGDELTIIQAVSGG
jgi:molybdopterin converting factor small subunit